MLKLAIVFGSSQTAILNLLQHFYLQICSSLAQRICTRPYFSLNAGTVYIGVLTTELLSPRESTLKDYQFEKCLVVVVEQP